MLEDRGGGQDRQGLERPRWVLVLLAALLPASLVAVLWWIGWETRIDNRFHPLVSLWSLIPATAVSAGSVGIGVRDRRYGAVSAGVVGFLIPLGVGIALQLGGDVEYALNCRQYHECSDAQFMLLSLWGIWGSVTTGSLVFGLRFSRAFEGARRLVLALATIAFGVFGGYAVGWWYGVFFGFIAGVVASLFVLFMPRGRGKQAGLSPPSMVWSPAHEAVERGDLETLVELLDGGADVDDPDWDGATLLHHAIDVEVDGAVQSGQPLRVGLTKVLVARGADLNWRWRGETPLEAAMTRGHYLAVHAIRAAAGGDSR